MTQTYVYNAVAQGNVRRRAVSLTEVLHGGRVGGGKVTIEDAPGTRAIVGHKAFHVEQDACSAPRTWTGNVAKRSYHGGEEDFVLPPSRLIDIDLVDLNERLSRKKLRKVHSANRPKESVSARITWLLAQTPLSAYATDRGFVSYPATQIDKANYVGRFPVDVLKDMAEHVGFEYGLYWDPSGTPGVGLVFADWNVSTSYTSTIKISDAAGDANGTSVFASLGRAKLDSDPSRVVSGVWGQHKRGNVYRTRAATELAFEPRDGEMVVSDIKTRAKARVRADRFLFDHRNEEHLIRDRIRCQKEYVNLLRAGHRMQAKYTRFATEGFGAYNWFRVLERTVSQPDDTDEWYELELALSPQEAGCSVQPSFVQYKWQTSVATPPGSATFRYSLDAASTVGNLLVLAIIGGNSVFSVPSGWTAVTRSGGSFVNVDLKDPGGRLCSLIYKKSEGESYVDVLHGGTTNAPRGILIEYSGLTNPTQYADAVFNRTDGIGYTYPPAISYPSGPSAVLAIPFMEIGPNSGNALAVSGTNLTLRTPQDSAAPGFFGAPCLAVGDWLRDGSAGATVEYPGAGGWRFTFTADPCLCAGVVFVGDNC